MTDEARVLLPLGSSVLKFPILTRTVKRRIVLMAELSLASAVVMPVSQVSAETASSMSAPPPVNLYVSPSLGHDNGSEYLLEYSGDGTNWSTFDDHTASYTASSANESVAGLRPLPAAHRDQLQLQRRQHLRNTGLRNF